MDRLVGALSKVSATLGDTANNVLAKAPGGPPAPAEASKGEYLRLPVESARRLRWFEKADLQALTKSHLREKRELLDTVAALKKALLRHGVDESKVDAEVAAHLRAAAEVAEAHEGVASVLLAALEPHVKELRFENDRLKAALAMNQAAVVAGGAAAAANGSASSGGAAGESAVGANGIASSSSSAAAAGLHAAPSSGALAGGLSRGSLAAGGAGAGPVVPALHVPLRLEHLDLAQCGGRAAARMDPLAKQQMAALEAELERAGKQAAELKAQLAKLQQQQAAAARRRGPDGGGDAVGLAAMQDMVLEAQEAAREEARRAQRAEARAGRLEGELKALQAQQKALSKEHGALQQQLAALSSQLAEAQAAASSASAAEESRAAAEAREELAALRAVNAGLQADLVAARANHAKLDADLQLSYQREAATAAALTEAEALAGRCDELAAANMTLTQRLADSRSELEMAGYYKKMCTELTEAKGKLESDLLGLAQQLVAAEHRVTDLSARLADSEELSRQAEGRARAAEAAVSAEVERRCGAVLSSRALWPAALREEVMGLERRAAELDLALATATRNADTASREAREAQVQLLTKTDELAALSAESVAAASAAADQLQHLRAALAESQARAAGLKDALEEARAEARAAGDRAAREPQAGAGPRPLSGSSGNLQHRTSSSGNMAGAAQGGGGGGGGGHGPVHGPSAVASVPTPRWQVQNVVGGGGLYNLSNGLGHGGGAGGGHGSAGDGGGLVGSQTPTDMVYLKNLLLKFLEAHMLSKITERDALLPAVGTLLQASPAEYAALQKILKATQPPSRQMLSVFGLSR
ncbi:hypothetical protein HYH02_003985 [Chlamydomonas schloesseri]|uniref:GRIP domain-containing protein n=1 Tax=Chlamydomonas schloesseri TaxID=2026947 RepID=A0A835WQA9_9CHLO|nr:hypothetical protein HYH02_003985 [Chlamydomonas schloesseri]|eukprot:KAG2451383.1 hypothetical protein HYH02_003985 [Chlamydomonas schloesseri]